MSIDNIKYNELMHKLYSTSPTEDILNRYVLSEIYSPIADYPNAVKIIMEAEKKLLSNKLLFTGAYIWTTQIFKKNPFLVILKESIEKFSIEEKAIYYYLSALDLNYTLPSEKEIIKNYLERSISYNTIFVANYLDLLKIVTDDNEKKSLLYKAKKNVKRVFTVEECKKLGYEYYYNIDNYNDEYIKEISLNEFQYLTLFQKKEYENLL
ncbi:hypothetical protein [Treponema pedis]|nr:hypothetical protein [Treponema pedis]